MKKKTDKNKDKILESLENVYKAFYGAIKFGIARKRVAAIEEFGVPFWATDNR